MISVVDKELIKHSTLSNKNLSAGSPENLDVQETVRKALVDGDEPGTISPAPSLNGNQPYLDHSCTVAAGRKTIPLQTTLHRPGIYNRLVDEYDYQGSESSVRRVVAELRQAEKETYIHWLMSLVQTPSATGEADIYILMVNIPKSSCFAYA
jgi:hypothetical protein